MLFYSGYNNKPDKQNLSFFSQCSPDCYISEINFILEGVFLKIFLILEYCRKCTPIQSQNSIKRF